jgi:hypothetical protein
MTHHAIMPASQYGRALRDMIEQYLAEAGPAAAAAAAAAPAPAAAAAPAPAAAAAPASAVAESIMPSVFHCPLTGEIMRDPVVDLDGNRSVRVEGPVSWHVASD